MTRTAVHLCPMVAALFLGATPVVAQQPLGQPLGQPIDRDHGACPSADPNDGTPLELRMAGRLVRVQVRDLAEDIDGASVQVRLVGCDTADSEGDGEEPTGAGTSDAAESPRSDNGSPLLRLMHDLRVGLELAPTDEGRCIRARIAFDDRGATAPPPAGAGRAPGEPVEVELCGLPFPVPDRADRP